jgi:hypothetical protein
VPASHPVQVPYGATLHLPRARVWPLSEQAHHVSTRRPSAQPAGVATHGLCTKGRSGGASGFQVSGLHQAGHQLVQPAAPGAAHAVAARQSSVLPGRHWPLDCPKRRMRTPTATNQTWRAAGSVSTHLFQTQRTLSSPVKGGPGQSSSFTGLPTPEGPGSTPKRHSCRRVNDRYTTHRIRVYTRSSKKGTSTGSTTGAKQDPHAVAGPRRRTWSARPKVSGEAPQLVSPTGTTFRCARLGREEERCRRRRVR